MPKRPKQTKNPRWLRAGGAFALSLTIMIAFLMLIGPAIALPFESPLVDIQLWLIGLGPLVTSIFLAGLAWSGADLREARKKKQRNVLLTGFGIGLATFLLGLAMRYITSLI